MKTLQQATQCLAILLSGLVAWATDAHGAPWPEFFDDFFIGIGGGYRF